MDEGRELWKQRQVHKLEYSHRLYPFQFYARFTPPDLGHQNLGLWRIRDYLTVVRTALKGGRKKSKPDDEWLDIKLYPHHPEGYPLHHEGPLRVSSPSVIECMRAIWEAENYGRLDSYYIKKLFCRSGAFPYILKIGRTVGECVEIFPGTTGIIQRGNLKRQCTKSSVQAFNA